MTTYSKVFSGTTVLYKAASVEVLFYDNILKTETYIKLYTFYSILLLYTSYLIFIKKMRKSCSLFALPSFQSKRLPVCKIVCFWKHIFLEKLYLQFFFDAISNTCHSQHPCTYTLLTHMSGKTMQKSPKLTYILPEVLVISTAWKGRKWK